MVLFFQLILYLIFFTASIALVTKDGPIGGIFFYPKPVQERVLELRLTDARTIRKRKTVFFIVFMIGVIGLPIIFIGIWSKVTDFRTAFFHALILLEMMNWYDGIVVDRVWVGHSKFWIIKGAEDLPYVKSVRKVVAERTIMTLVYVPVSAFIAWLSIRI